MTKRLTLTEHRQRKADATSNGGGSPAGAQPWGHYDDIAAWRKWRAARQAPRVLLLGKAPAAARVAKRANPGALVVAIVGCGASKLDRPAPARELYTGSLFRAGIAHAEASADRTFIASALHGLIRPDTVIAPYNERLPKSSGGTQFVKQDPTAGWRRRIGEQLRAELASELATEPNGIAIIIYAGRDYAEPLREAARDGLAEFRVTVVDPLAGKPIGERLHWFKEARQARARGESRPDLSTFRAEVATRDAYVPPTFTAEEDAAFFERQEARLVMRHAPKASHAGKRAALEFHGQRKLFNPKRTNPTGASLTGGAPILRQRHGAWFVTFVHAYAETKDAAPMRARSWYRCQVWNDTLRENLRDGAELVEHSSGLYSFELRPNVRAFVRLLGDAPPEHYETQGPIPPPRGDGWRWDFHRSRWERLGNRSSGGKRRGEETRFPDLTWRETAGGKLPQKRKPRTAAEWPYAGGFARLRYVDTRTAAGQLVAAGTVLPILSVGRGQTLELGHVGDDYSNRVNVRIDEVERAPASAYRRTPAPAPAPRAAAPKATPAPLAVETSGQVRLFNPRANPVRLASGGPILEVSREAGGLLSERVLASISVVLLDGRAVRFNRGATLGTKPLALSVSEAREAQWFPLRRKGVWNEKIRAALRGRSGVYAIRERGAGRTVLYVGEGGKARRGGDGARARSSHDPARLWKTITRHFHAGFWPERYAAGEIIGKKRAQSHKRDGGKQSAGIAYAQVERAGRKYHPDGGIEYKGGGREWTYHGKGDVDVALYLVPPTQLRETESQWIAELDPVDQGELVIKKKKGAGEAGDDDSPF